MFAWRKCTFEGRTTNGWDQKAGTGKVEHVATEAFAGGPVFGRFTVKLRQLDLTAPDGPKPVLDETWRVRVYGLDDVFVFDVEVSQQCAGKSPGPDQRDSLRRNGDSRSRRMVQKSGLVSSTF